MTPGGVEPTVQVETGRPSNGSSVPDDGGLWESFEDFDDEVKQYTSAMEKEMETWTKERLWIHNLVSSTRFDFVMGTLISANVILLLAEADQRAECYNQVNCRSSDVAILAWLNRLLLLIYIIEASARGFAARRRYWKDRWNLLDFTVVVVGLVDELAELILQGQEWQGMQVMPILRVFRVLRLVRALRLLRFHPELYLMICGFLGAMRAMFWGLVLIMLLLVVWSFICVEVIHPINKEMFAERRLRGEETDALCEEAFSSVFDTSIFLFQTLVAGDAWGECTVPIIRHQRLTFVIFALSLVSVTLGFMNLILAVIVDHAQEARMKDHEDRLREKKKQQEEGLVKWREVIQQVDVDGSGSISLKELMAGYKFKEVRDTLNALGIDKKDLGAMFSLMDDDGSGDLDYGEFIDTFIKAQGQDLRIYLMMTKLQTDAVARTSKQMARDLERISAEVASYSSEPDSQVGKSAQVEVRGAAQATAVSLDADLKRLNGRIQKQFEALARSVNLEFSSIAQARNAASNEADAERREVAMFDAISQDARPPSFQASRAGMAKTLESKGDLADPDLHEAGSALGGGSGEARKDVLEV